jgi:hypothetical protein
LVLPSQRVRFRNFEDDIAGWSWTDLKANCADFICRDDLETIEHDIAEFASRLSE